MHEEPTIRIESREELIYMLAEAAEIEHNVMCCYLYAAWSLKRGERDGLSAEDAAMVRSWKAGINAVAVEEMTHLALACNLLSAIGAGPHLSRPNFPVPAGYHPSGVVVELAGFSPAVLDHCIYLERPEGKELHDSSEFVHPADYHRTQPRGHIMASAQDYETVGHLYRGIRQGFEVLAHHIGEEALFCGDVASQIGPGDAHLPGLCLVRDLDTAIQAIETIIEQGEGAPEHTEDSHYARFLAVREQYNARLKDDPDFAPAFPVAHSPVMYEPLDKDHRIHITEPEASDVLDLANSIYGHMLRLLVQSYGRAADEQEDKHLYVGAAIDLMEALVPIGEHLASLPANPDHPGIHAGVTFTTMRDVARLPRGAGEKQMLAERLGELATQARRIFPAGHDLAGTGDTLDALVKGFGVEKLKTVGAVHTGDAPKPDDLPSKQSPDVEVAEGKDMAINFDSARCIHARFCVLGAPAVFKANTPGEWIFPDEMSADALTRIAYNCPSGAITYTRKDGGADEEAPPVNLIYLRENGPYAFRGPLTVDGEEIGFRATLCRCGASKAKPFCDGSHVEIGFKATGEPATRESEPLTVRDGPVDIAPQTDGPLKVKANLEICSGTGRTVDRVTAARLCRCGGSRTKPFCDGTHAKIGFKSG